MTPPAVRSAAEPHVDHSKFINLVCLIFVHIECAICIGTGTWRIPI